MSKADENDPALAVADAFAKVRAEAMRRAEHASIPSRAAFLEIAEYCDQQEQATLNRRKRH